MRGSQQSQAKIAGAAFFFAAIALPGAVIADDISRDRICAAGYARAQRLRPEQYYPLAQAAYQRAGIPWSERRGHVLDHIVPLCLGGNWAPDNLQIQTVADAARKDRLEIAACREVCAGRITVGEARSWFARR